MVRWVLAAAVVVGVGSCKKDDEGERPSNAACVAPERVSGGGRFDFEPRYPSLSLADPVSLTWSEGAPGWWYVVEQDGRILRFAEDGNGSQTEVVLDIRSQVARASELGLLGLAFHPDFADNGEIFVNYTNDDAGLETRIARFTSSDGGASFGSEEILFRVDQPFQNHNAGHLAFGPDGYLYFGLGDGGSGGDPLGSGQDLGSHLGKMLRIDVDGGTPYAIPAGNPFARTGGGLPEIYAWGLRNPWRFSFDSATGELWLGDVGQNTTEEVDRIQAGGNYGWNITEGRGCFSPPTDCDRSGLIAPEATYANPGQATVIGGIVYRGTAVPGLVGTYLYNDFYSNTVYALAGGEVDEAATAPGRIVHWEEGPDGEAWVLTYGGSVHQLVPKGSGQVTGGPAALLSQTGCVNPSAPSEPASGVVAFDIAHPFWSDQADKRRWFAIPDGTTIAVQPDGDWDFPVGSVLIKEFSRGGSRIETRLLTRHDDGEWAGYAYRWRADGSDADLLPAGIEVDADGPWTIPDRAACLSCHTEAAGGSLGPHSSQLGAQAVELAELGMLVGLGNDAPATWPAVDDAGVSVEERARTWLEVNCSSCHRPDGGSRTDWDFRMSASAADLGVCATPGKGDLGVAGAQVIAPGDPDSSVLWMRMSRRDAYQMPPLGSHQVDEVASEVLREWISGLAACP